MNAPSLRIWLARLAPLLGVLLFGLALLVLRHELADFRWSEVGEHLRALPRARWLGALALCALSYAALAGYDLLGAYHLKLPVSRAKTAFAGLVAWAMSNTVGHALLSGGSVRMRLHSGWGVSPGAVTRLVAFCSLTFWMGFAASMGVAILLDPPASLGSFGPIVGIIGVALPMTLAVVARVRKRPIQIRGWEFPLPGPGVAAAQVGLGIIDQLTAAGVLYLLLPETPSLHFTDVLLAFCLANAGGLASQIPGGAGAFDSAMVSLLAPYVPAPAAFGAVLLWRLVYNVGPLLLAGVSLAGFETWAARSRLAGAGAAARRVADLVGPGVLGALVFVGGIILLISGATPAAPARLNALEQLIPLPILESSHLVGSLAGVALLFVARGVSLRLREAWVMAEALLLAGVGASLLKGLDVEEASFLFTVALIAWPARRRFYRQAALTGHAFSPPWLVSIAGVLAGATALLLWAFSHVPYEHALWTRFAVHAEASRGLRALAVASGVAAVIGLGALLRPAHPPAETPSPEDLETAARIAAGAANPKGWMAMLGDKSLLFNETRTAFIMFGVSGRVWVACGDPVGPEEEWPELAWSFRELADEWAARIAFYEVGPRALPLYLELGLGAFKFGEEAVLPLAGFSLEGSAHKGHRQVMRRMEKEGVRFEVVPPEGVEPLLPALAAISKAWMRGKNAREKGFSLGFFHDDYLKRCPVAVARKGDAIVAFASLLVGGARGELGIDLMRFAPDAPTGAMEFLLLSVQLWAAKEGFRQLSLGMVPLSGLPDRDLAPLWARAGSFVFRQGETYYNFQGLRLYKEKFHPQWEPRYLAAPGGLALTGVLTAVAKLTAGGLMGVVRR